MMKTYKKPIVLLNGELAEGVYAASGSVNTGSTGTTGSTNTGTTESNTPACQSVYINGVYHPINWSNPKGTNIEVRGCEGCPVNWGRCAVSEASGGDTYMPSWEREGKKPNDPANP